jgi:VanZ family protein
MRTGNYTLGAMAWMAVIVLFSSQPGDRLGPDSIPLDVLKKIGHCVEFGVLAVLYLYVLKGGRPVGEAGMRVFLPSFLLVVLFAITDEYHQSFTPGRHSSVVDVFIDSCGAIVFLGLLHRVKADGK